MHEIYFIFTFLEISWDPWKLHSENIGNISTFSMIATYTCIPKLLKIMISPVSAYWKKKNINYTYFSLQIQFIFVVFKPVRINHVIEIYHYPSHDMLKRKICLYCRLGESFNIICKSVCHFGSLRYGSVGSITQNMSIFLQGGNLQFDPWECNSGNLGVPHHRWPTKTSPCTWNISYASFEMLITRDEIYICCLRYILVCEVLVQYKTCIQKQ